MSKFNRTLSLCVVVSVLFLLSVASVATAQKPVEEGVVSPSETTPVVQPAAQPVEDVAKPVEESVNVPVEESVITPAEDTTSVAAEGKPVEDSVAAPIESTSLESLANLSPMSAKTASWQTSVTYQNVGSADATINFNFYKEQDGTAIPYTVPVLKAGAGASLYIGSISNISAGFRGSAVVSSDQLVVATVVQFSPDAGFKMRMLSNGFQSSDASEQYLIATTLKNKFSRSTVFSVQNTESEAIVATIKFYDADAAGALASTKTFDIPAGSSKYVDMDTTDSGITAASFNGSAIVTAVKKSGGVAKVVAAASEYYLNQDIGANYEGVPLSQAAATIYMATGLCQNSGLDTFYAVQNASLTDSTWIKVTYRDTAGATKATDGPYQLSPGGKKSIDTCNPSDKANMVGFTGSAVVTSYKAQTGTTADGSPIVAIGKAQKSLKAEKPNTLLVLTAFLSQSQGYSKLALPFIRWANDTNFIGTKPGSQRTYIAIQNVDGTPIKVNVTYKDKNGATTGTPQALTIPAFAKGSSNPQSALGLSGTTEFGYYTDGTFGGGVTIEADASNPNAKFIAIVRANNNGASEDYNAMPY